MSVVALTTPPGGDDNQPPRKGGRPKGSRNKITKEIRSLAQRHGPKALRALVKLLADKDPQVRHKAAVELIDRGYGKPVAPSTIGIRRLDQLSEDELLALLGGEPDPNELSGGDHD
jgi:hypothetical protein